MYTFASTAGGGAMVLPYPVEREEQAVKTLVKPANDRQATAEPVAPEYQTSIKKSRT